MADDEVGGMAPLRRKRRSWTIIEKRRIVDESLESGASLAEVARRHDLNANQLFTWRRRFSVETVPTKPLEPMLPVTITPDMTGEEPDRGSRGQMEIVLAKGDRILVWSDVDAAALTRVLKSLSRR